MGPRGHWAVQLCRQHPQLEAGGLVLLGCEARRLQFRDAGSVDLLGISEAGRLQGQAVDAGGLDLLGCGARPTMQNYERLKRCMTRRKPRDPAAAEPRPAAVRGEPSTMHASPRCG